MRPFSEVNIFDSTTDPFYTTGSVRIGEIPNSFANKLRNKEQIRKTFLVKNPVMMLPNSCSIYYFNFKNQQWNIPTRSIDDHVGPFERYSFPTYEISDVLFPDTTKGSAYIEDAKGFDSYGNAVSSGSLDIFRQVSTFSSEYAQTIEVIGQQESVNEAIEWMTKDYTNSVQRASIYEASEDETFELGVDRPFLLEKAVIEIPMNFGTNWFYDSTSTCMARASGSYGSPPTQIGTPPITGYYDYFNKGGPAITFSLMCQKKYGQNSIRDLIMSGVITHFDDSVSSNTIRLHGSFNGFNTYAIEATGIKGPTTVVTKDANAMFTGSVNMKLTSAISNGLANSLIINFPINYVENSQYHSTGSFIDFYRNVISQKVININSLFTKSDIDSFVISYTKYQVTSIDPFGRGMTGFSPSGGSIFGQEYATPQPPGLVNSFINNPFYVEDEGTRNAIVSDITLKMYDFVTIYGLPFPAQVLGYFTICANDTNFVTTKESPYVINPNDKLILTLSKTRPVITASCHYIPDSTSAMVGRSKVQDVNYRSGLGASGHDVTLATGSINVTFYGSYVRMGSRYTPDTYGSGSNIKHT